MIKVRRVVGDSMSPTCLSGDVVVAFVAKRPKEGDVVIAKCRGREVIKRVSRIKSGKYYLLGDNPAASTDSRSFGEVDKTDILGVIIMKLQQAKVIEPPKPLKPHLVWVSNLLAIFITLSLLLVLMYLYKGVTSLQIVLGVSPLLAKAMAACIVLVMLGSLPFLLRIRLSPLARFISAASLLIMPLVPYALLLIDVLQPPVSTAAIFDFIVIGTLYYLPFLVWSYVSFYILNGPSVLTARAATTAKR